MGNLAGEKDSTIKASYKFKNGYIYLTLTSKTGFSDVQMEEAYLYDSDSEWSLGPDPWHLDGRRH